jgi:hypothetical protein
MRKFVSTLKVLAVVGGIAVGVGLASGLIAASHPPTWALGLAFLGYVGIFYAAHQIRRNMAWMRCELRGHWSAVFEKYDDTGYCPRCKESIATRPPESDGPGMPTVDTVHERISRLEEALLRVEHALGTEQAT